MSQRVSRRWAKRIQPGSGAVNRIVSPSGIEDLCSKREELNRQIKLEEEEKERLQHDIRVLSEKLSRVNESLAQRLVARTTFDRTIAETEAAYTKVCGETELLSLRSLQLF